MKNIVSKVSTAMVLSQLWAYQAFAQLKPPECAGGIECGDANTTSIRTLVVKYLTLVLDFITLIGVIYVIIAGIRLIVSGGDEGEKDKAKKTILYVVIGILVIIFARVVVTFVASIGASTSS